MHTSHSPATFFSNVAEYANLSDNYVTNVDQIKFKLSYVA